MSKKMKKIFGIALFWGATGLALFSLATWGSSVRQGISFFHAAGQVAPFDSLGPADLTLDQPPSDPAATNGWYYTVRRGDTIFNIAKRVGVSVGTIRSYNGLWSNALRIGQRILIPSGGGGGGSRSSASAAPTRVSGDSYMLARLIQAEAGAEPYVGKVAVGAVVMNRIDSPKFPKTIAGIIFQPHAFESVSNGIYYNAPSNDSMKAARDAINGWDPSGGALFFFNPAKTSNPYIWSRRIIARFGKHVFAL